MKISGRVYSHALVVGVFTLTLGAFAGFTEPRQKPPSSGDRPARVNRQPSVGPAHASSEDTIITQVEIGRLGDQTIVRVEGSGRLTCQTERLNNPERVVLDFSGARLSPKRTLIPSGLKPVLRVRLGQFKPDVARVVIDIEPGVRYDVKLEGKGVTVAFASAIAAAASGPVAPETPDKQGKKEHHTRRNEVAEAPALAPVDTSGISRPKSVAERKATLANPAVPEAKAETFENAFRNGMLTFHAKNQTLRSILEQIGDKAKVGIVLGEGLGNEQISVEFQHYRVDEALHQILKDYDAFFFYGAAEGKTGAATLKAVWVYAASRGRGLKPAPPDISAARATEVLMRPRGHQSADEVLEALKGADEKVRTRVLHRALSSGVGIPQESLINLALNDESASVRVLAFGALPVDPKLRWVAERALYDSNPAVSQMAREILSELDAAVAPPSARAGNQPKPPNE